MDFLNFSRNFCDSWTQNVSQTAGKSLTVGESKTTEMMNYNQGKKQLIQTTSIINQTPPPCQNNPDCSCRSCWLATDADLPAVSRAWAERSRQRRARGPVILLGAAAQTKPRSIDCQSRRQQQRFTSHPSHWGFCTEPLAFREDYSSSLSPSLSSISFFLYLHICFLPPTSCLCLLPLLCQNQNSALLSGFLIKVLEGITQHADNVSLPGVITSPEKNEETMKCSLVATDQCLYVDFTPLDESSFDWLFKRIMINLIQLFVSVFGFS